MKASERLKSLDALRGFDMFFIIGGSAMVVGLCRALGWGDGCWLAHQMRHVPWAGLVHHDTIFPLFLFLAGVSWPFSYAAQLARNRSSFQIHRKVVVRMLILFLLGMTLGGLLKFNPPFRIPSVLGQIGLSWGFAALIFMHVRKPVLRALIVATLLFGYWALLAFAAVPGAPVDADPYCRAWNVISWFDRTLMPNYILMRNVYDPESLFAVPPGIALALLGMLAGSILRSSDHTPRKKVCLLMGFSALTFVMGAFFIFVLKMPIVKALWTSSFVLMSAAYSFAMLALFYGVIDVLGWSRWSFVFRVIGMNAITVYMFQNMRVNAAVNTFFLSGLVSKIPAPWHDFAAGLAAVATAWVILYLFYRKNLFLKV